MTEGPGFLVRGMVLGFSIAAPVGPIGVLCIRRTLAEDAARARRMRWVNPAAGAVITGFGALALASLWEARI